MLMLKSCLLWDRISLMKGLVLAIELESFKQIQKINFRFFNFKEKVEMELLGFFGKSTKFTFKSHFKVSF